ncbi:hypothetical protein D3C86_1503370 [compost metagenome]
MSSILFCTKIMVIGKVIGMSNMQPMPLPEALQTLAETMKRRRHELNKMSQDDLAIASGVPKGTIGTIEAGNLKGPPTIPTLRGIEKGLRLQPGTLLNLFYGGVESAAVLYEELTPEKRKVLELLDRIQGEDLEIAIRMLSRLARD